MHLLTWDMDASYCGAPKPGQPGHDAATATVSLVSCPACSRLAEVERHVRELLAAIRELVALPTPEPDDLHRAWLVVAQRMSWLDGFLSSPFRLGHEQQLSSVLRELAVRVPVDYRVFNG